MSSSVFKVIIPVSGIGVAGTVGAWYFYPREKGQEVIRDKFKDVFRHALLNSSEDEIWTSKLSKLKSTSIHGVNEKLSRAKSNSDQDNGKQLLLEACNSIYETGFLSKESDEYKNFKYFCARNNKDRLTESKFIGEEDSSLTKQVQAISSAQGTFSSSFKKKVKDLITDNGASTEQKNAVKNWCAEFSEEPYAKDLASTDFETYCQKKG